MPHLVFTAHFGVDFNVVFAVELHPFWQQLVARNGVIDQTHDQQRHADKAEFKKAKGALPGLGQHGVDNAVGGRTHKGYRSTKGRGKGHRHKHFAGGKLCLHAHAKHHGHGHNCSACVRENSREQANGRHGVHDELNRVALGEFYGQPAYLVGKACYECGLAHNEHGHEEHHCRVAKVAKSYLGRHHIGE